jgi:hypothetical protein
MATTGEPKPMVAAIEQTPFLTSAQISRERGTGRVRG